MGTFKIEGGIQLKGDVQPQGAKNEALQVLCPALLTSEKVNTWICGHIHKNFDFFTENGTRVVGNQKGKQKDKINDFYKNFTINM